MAFKPIYFDLANLETAGKKCIFITFFRFIFTRYVTLVLFLKVCNWFLFLNCTISF